MVWFKVTGKIRGKARPRVTRRGVYTPKETKEYEKLIQTAYKCAAEGQYFGDKAVNVEIWAYFAIPKSYTKGKRLAAVWDIIPPTKRPDCDNIAKVVCDALNGTAWDDDAQVVDLHVVKAWTASDEQIEVRVREARA